MYRIIVNPSCVDGLPITKEIGIYCTHQAAIQDAKKLMAVNKGVDFYQEIGNPNMWRGSRGGWLRIEKTTGDKK